MPPTQYLLVTSAALSLPEIAVHLQPGLPAEIPLKMEFFLRYQLSMRTFLDNLAYFDSE